MKFYLGIDTFSLTTPMNKKVGIIGSDFIARSNLGVLAQNDGFVMTGSVIYGKTQNCLYYLNQLLLRLINVTSNVLERL